nr:MAG TPA: hypothetical protein [Caudoviricetes sp.]
MVYFYANRQTVLYVTRIKIGLFNIRSSFVSRGHCRVKSNGAKQKCY